MINNIFESALSKNETNFFFMGIGEYRVPSPDYEGHIYGANIGGPARTYSEESNLKANRGHP